MRPARYSAGALPVPTGLQPQELKVLAWTDHFFGPRYLDPVTVPLPAGGEIRLEFTRDRDQLGSVDAVWFHGPTIKEVPPLSAKQQPWILMSMESEVNYPALKHPVTRAVFDIFMTYRLDADVPCIYPNWQQYGDFRQRPPRVREAASLAVYIASNPVAYRDDYARELMQHLAVDSLGSCLNNQQPEHFVRGGWGEGAWESILSVLPSYRFYLAFENSRAVDYVTERVFHALVAGTVPVYLGAPNVRDFMPSADAVIVADDFGSPRELAEHLLMLSKDNGAYDRHLQWKDQPYSVAFQNLLDLGSTDPRQRLAIVLAQGGDSRVNCGGRLREPGLLP